MDTDWDVNEILGHIKRNGVIYYLVKWGASEEPAHMLNHCPEKIKQYWDTLLRDSTVSSSSQSIEEMLFTKHHNSSIVESSNQNTESEQVHVQSQLSADVNPSTTKIQNVPSKLKKKRTKQLKKQKLQFCHPCSKSFFNAGSLKRHQREIHNSIIRFKCNTCETDFSRKNSLDIHSYRCNFKFENLLFWKW